MAAKAGVEENDALLVRALKAEENAKEQRDWMSTLEMDIAKWAFMEGHFEFRNAWPPEVIRIDMLLRKFSRGSEKPDEIEEFRRLASETFRDWQPQYPAGFKQRIESALNWLNGNPLPGKKMPNPYRQTSAEPQQKRELFPPSVPPSKDWLAGLQNLGLDESNSVVAQALEILQKAEVRGISREEIIEFHVLNDALLDTYGRKRSGMREADVIVAEAKDNLSDEEYRRLARMTELSQKIGAGTNSREELEEQYEAATPREWCYDTCRRPARSHAASARPSIGSKSHAYRSQKAPTSLIS
ncbi:MAG TPA: hypothetical protein VEH30_01115 [Terriglobales bacterium]|nr:hypothetical protein [Terriglobales bacterium]